MQMKLAFQSDILKQVISMDSEHTWFFFSVYCHYFYDDKKQKGDGTKASLEVVYSSIQTF